MHILCANTNISTKQFNWRYTIYFSIFKTPEGLWQWRILTDTDAIMVNSDVSYNTKDEVIEAIKRIRQPAKKMRLWDSVSQAEIAL